MGTNTGRTAYFDNIRIALIILVLMHHAGQAYGPTGGWWAYQETERARILGIFFGVNRSFFMSLFFFISGYFMPGAFDRKGPAKFLADRFKRLGIPLLVFLLAIIPLIHYCYFLNFRPYGYIGFFEYYTNFWFGMGVKPADWTGPAWPELNFAQLWFVEHLLIYACFYVLWKFLRKGPTGREMNAPLPKGWQIIAFSLLIMIITALVRIPYPIDKWIGLLGFIQVAFADVPRDLGWFILGVVAYRKNWLERFPAKSGYIWLGLGIGLSLLYSIMAWFRIFPDELYGLWETFLCTGFCIGFVILFREKVNGSNKLSVEMGLCTYGVYLFHVPILVIFQYMFASVPTGPLVKFICVSAIATVVTFAFTAVLRRLPLAREIL
jgi:peptidoglycan/LPS O-acetylase OafA/YrhL